MQRAMDEIKRAETTEEYNKEHGITPRHQEGLQGHHGDGEISTGVSEDRAGYSAIGNMSREDKARLVDELEKQMKKAAKNLDFERAALLRDRIVELRRDLITDTLPPT
jgi:excinuclease ABC subunit B